MSGPPGSWVGSPAKPMSSLCPSRTFKPVFWAARSAAARVEVTNWTLPSSLTTSKRGTNLDSKSPLRIAVSIKDLASWSLVKPVKSLTSLMTLVLPMNGVWLTSNTVLKPFNAVSYCLVVNRLAFVPWGRMFSVSDFGIASNAVNAECNCGWVMAFKSSTPVALRKKSLKPCVVVSTFFEVATFKTSWGSNLTDAS